jgi:hypothetical protein
MIACGRVGPRAAWRRAVGFRTVASGSVKYPITQQEFNARVRAYHLAATSRGQLMQSLVHGLWRCEGLAVSAAKYPESVVSLSDPALPAGARGITHVGFGAGATESSRFDTEQFATLLEASCHPAYRPFAIEGVGSMLRIYQDGPVRRLCGLFGVIPGDAPAAPARENFYRTFLSGFTRDEQRLVAHGYGRLVAFGHLGLKRALTEAAAVPAFFVGPCTQGVGFAFAMMNASDMAALLASDLAPPEQSEHFEAGLVAALVFLEWFSPGILGSWAPGSRREERLIARAADESRLNHENGHLLPFLAHTW